MNKNLFLHLFSNGYGSGSQPGCRELVSGVPPNIDKADQGCRETKKVEKHLDRVLKHNIPRRSNKVELLLYFNRSRKVCFPMLLKPSNIKELNINIGGLEVRKN